MSRIKLGSFLRKCRERQGITQTAVAEHLDVTPAHICDVEMSRRTVSLERLESLLSLLNVRGPERVKVYQSYGQLPTATRDALLKCPDLWDVKFDEVLAAYRRAKGAAK